MKKELITRVTEELDNGIFIKSRIRYVPNDDSQEAKEAAFKANLELMPPFDWVTSEKARAETLAWAEELYVASGGAALQEARAKVTDLLKSPRRKKRRSGMRLTDFSPSTEKRIREAMRDRDKIASEIFTDAATEAFTARGYIWKLIEEPSETEIAFRAGWHLSRAQALIRAKVAKHGQVMNSNRAAKQKGRIRKKRDIQQRFEDAFQDWREDNPDAADAIFWKWFLSTKEDIKEDFKLTINEGDTPEKRDTWKIFLDGTNQKATGRTMRSWLNDIKKI